MQVPWDTIEAYTFLELPDCPWVRAYHRWAAAGLEKVSMADSKLYLTVLLSSLDDFRAAGQSEAEVLRSLFATGKPAPYFGTFAPVAVGWRSGTRA